MILCLHMRSTSIHCHAVEITSHFQGLLHAREQELQSLRQYSAAHGNEGENSATLMAELQQKKKEVEELRLQVTDLQQKEINEAFGLGEGNGDTAQELRDLQQEYAALMGRYHALEAQNAEQIPAEKLEERDAFWRGELQQMEVSHREALKALQEGGAEARQSAEELVAARLELEQSQHLWRQEKEKMCEERQRSEEEIARLQRSLEERDTIWQQELVSGQKEQQDLRQQCEAVKVAYRCHTHASLLYSGVCSESWTRRGRDMQRSISCMRNCRRICRTNSISAMLRRHMSDPSRKE